ncbi:hypothetical protein HKBW3C_00885 [Candidatus Hakubella thermalkaliphila]|nr:hypothetical protein HKBW3C_00885 [Candidatus Hakubella thermalkaliphila]
MRVDSKGIKLAIEDVFCFLSKSLIYEKEAYRMVAEREEIEDPDNSPELLWHIKEYMQTLSILFTYFSSSFGLLANLQNTWSTQ